MSRTFPPEAPPIPRQAPRIRLLAMTPLAWAVLARPFVKDRLFSADHRAQSPMLQAAAGAVLVAREGER